MAFIDIFFRSAWSVIIVFIAPTILLISLLGTIIPLWMFIISCNAPNESIAIIGTPICKASVNTIPHPSAVLVIRNKDALHHRHIFAVGDVKRILGGISRLGKTQ